MLADSFLSMLLLPFVASDLSWGGGGVSLLSLLLSTAMSALLSPLLSGLPLDSGDCVCTFRKRLESAASRASN